MARGVRRDFDRFGLWAWGFPRSAYVVGFIWFGIFGGLRGVAAFMSRKNRACSLGWEG